MSSMFCLCTHYVCYCLLAKASHMTNTRGFFLEHSYRKNPLAILQLVIPWIETEITALKIIEDIEGETEMTKKGQETMVGGGTKNISRNEE